MSLFKVKHDWMFESEDVLAVRYDEEYEDTYFLINRMGWEWVNSKYCILLSD